jgi:hypothetical protein
VINRALSALLATFRSKRRHRDGLRFCRPELVALEERAVPAVIFNEREPNDTQATGNVITLPATQVLEIRGGLSVGTDEDWFKFTLAQRAGVFFDIDSRETKLSTGLDTFLTLYDKNGTQIVQNDNGYDFDTGYPAPNATPDSTSADSALYEELAAGTYAVRVSGTGGTGAYRLRISADRKFGNTIPALNSRPGAKATIFLDFNGHQATDVWGSYTAGPVDLNGNTSEIGPGERMFIRNVWRIIAEDFSPFNINVSTNYSGPIADKVAIRAVITSSAPSIIGEQSGLLGIAILNGFSKGGVSDSTFFTFVGEHTALNFGGGESGDLVGMPVEVADTTSHEGGHAFGLEHFENISTAIMEFSSSKMERATWHKGMTRNEQGSPPPHLQDDIAVLANGQNGFGLRADDFGNTIGAARVLTAAGRTYAARGVIRTTSDRDFFRFRATAGGPTVITANVDEYINDLNITLRVFNRAGALVATANPANSFDGSVSLNLAPADYYVQVTSNGVAGSVGQYSLTIRVPTPPGGGGGGGGGGVPPGPAPIPPRFTPNRNDNNETSSQAANLGTVLVGTQGMNALAITRSPTGLPDYDWYRFRPQRNGRLTVSTEVNSGGPLQLMVFRRVGNNLILVGKRTIGGGQTGRVSFTARRGEQLYVQVKGATIFPGFLAMGTYDLRFSLA